VGFAGGSGAEESADGLGERRGTFRKNLTRSNRNGGSRERAFPPTTFLSFSRGCDSLSVGGGALGGHGGRGGWPWKSWWLGHTSRGLDGRGSKPDQGGISLWRIPPPPRYGGISWQTPQCCHIVWEGKFTCSISGDPGPLRGRASLYSAVVGVEPEGLFPSLSLGEWSWCCQWGGTSLTTGV